MDNDKQRVNEVKKNVKGYWDIGSRYYDDSPGLYSTEEMACWTKELSEVIGERKLKVLDVGTGTGFIACIIAGLGHDVTGVDFSEKMLGVSKEKAAKAGLSIGFKKGDAEHLDFGNDTFDLVISRHLFWTLPQPDLAVKEWMRVTKPGGKIVIIDGVWKVQGIKQRVSKTGMALYRVFRYGLDSHRSRYSPKLRSKLPHPDGLTPDEIESYLSRNNATNINRHNLQYIREVQKKYLPLLLKYSYDQPTFLVSGNVRKMLK